MKKKLVTVVAALGLAASTPASAVIVGGIDFGPLGASPINTHLEAATIAQSQVTGDGQSAQAYGFITTVNGDNTYCADGSGNCGLFYVANFSGSQNFSPTYVEFTSATIDVYYTGVAPFNLLLQDSPTNILAIQALTPWLTLTGHANLGGGAAANAVLTGTGTLTGASISGSGAGLLDVTGGQAAVAAFLDANGISDAIGGLADIAFTSSFNNSVLNAFDVANGFANGCTDGTAAAGAWCQAGTADIRGDTVTVPEPGLLSLLGIGLFGLSAASRRRRK